MTVGFGVLMALIVIGVAVFFVTRSVGSATRGGRAVTDPQEDHLRYVVPSGQDPPVLLAALGGEGYDAATELVDGHHQVVVRCPAGRDAERAHVRAVIGSAHSTGLEGENFDPGDVVFADEHPGTRSGTLRENGRS